MSRSDLALEDLVRQAVGILSAVGDKLGVTRSMEIAGFSAAEIATAQIYQRVRQLAMKLEVVERRVPYAPVAPAAAANPAEGTTPGNNPVRTLVLDDELTPVSTVTGPFHLSRSSSKCSTGSKSSEKTPAAKKKRRTAKQHHKDSAAKSLHKE